MSDAQGGAAGPEVEPDEPVGDFGDDTQSDDGGDSDVEEPPRE